jgi:putative oxidoreductase
MTATTTLTPATPVQAHRRWIILRWAAQILLAVFFAAAALPKLAGAHSAVHMFAQLGAGSWLCYFVGAAELAGAIGLLIPRLAGLAAAGLTLDMAGASVVNAAILHSTAVVMTVALGAGFAVIAGSHWRARASR